MLSRVFGFGRPFSSLSEQEILALAISSEEDDARIYRSYAEGLEHDFPQSAKLFEEMAVEEDGHRAALIELHRRRFGERIPLIRREHVKGYYERKPDWLVRPLGIDKVRRQAELMERQAQLFYQEAAKRTSDASTRRLLGDLAAAEQGHETLAHELGQKYVPGAVRDEEAATERRQFILTYVQPGLAGLMDGSVSTLAPIFAAAFSTHDSWNAFVVGLAAILEVAGGLLLLVGLFTRPVAFVLAGEMAAAYFIAHAPNDFFPVNNGGDGAVLFCFIFLYLVFSGPGAWSLDRQRTATA